MAASLLRWSLPRPRGPGARPRRAPPLPPAGTHRSPTASSRSAGLRVSSQLILQSEPAPPFIPLYPYAFKFDFHAFPLCCRSWPNFSAFLRGPSTSGANRVSTEVCLLSPCPSILLPPFHPASPLLLCLPWPSVPLGRQGRLGSPARAWSESRGWKWEQSFPADET